MSTPALSSMRLSDPGIPFCIYCYFKCLTHSETAKLRFTEQDRNNVTLSLFSILTKNLITSKVLLAVELLKLFGSILHHPGF